MQTPVTPTNAPAAPRDHPLVPAGRVKGTAVFNRAGEKLGSVEDVAIDKESGKVAYAILSFGGFFGVGEHYYPVPWSLLKYDRARGGYVIPVEKETLEGAPSFDTDELSGWDDAERAQAIHAYYGGFGVTPYW